MVVFTARLSKWLYNQVKIFAKDNDISIMDAIRFILNQHFKNKI